MPIRLIQLPLQKGSLRCISGDCHFLLRPASMCWSRASCIPPASLFSTDDGWDSWDGVGG